MRLAITLMAVSGLVAGAATESSDPAVKYDRITAKAGYRRPESIPFPPGNAWTADREKLGRMLFFDPRISGSGFIACSSCHNPGFSWGDAQPKATGDGMKHLARRTPTILNLAWADTLFWDGRAASLEEQALGPIQSEAEMNMPIKTVIERVSSVPGYRALFAQAYANEGVTPTTIAKAIATFERTIVSSEAPFDRWMRGDEKAMSDSAKRGFDLFNAKAGCAKCHSGWNFTDNGFHDIGLPDHDQGRGAVIRLASMEHAFKTPTLRNVDHRGPYMHDGSESTLEDVVEFYNRGGRQQRPNLAPEVKALHLSDQEKADIVEFMKTLTSIDPPVPTPMLPR